MLVIFISFDDANAIFSDDPGSWDRGVQDITARVAGITEGGNSIQFVAHALLRAAFTLV